MFREKLLIILALVSAFLLEMLFSCSEYLALLAPVATIALFIFLRLKENNFASAWLLVLGISVVYGMLMQKNLGLLFLAFCLMEIASWLSRSFFFGSKLVESGQILLFFNFFALLLFWGRTFELSVFAVIVIANVLLGLLCRLVIDRLSARVIGKYKV
jgi:hypothetical protein